MSNDYVDLAAPLASLEDVQMKLLVPRPTELAVEDLVVELMGRARELGDVSRGEFVGALVLGARERADDLRDLVERYRNATVHEVWPHDGQTQGRRKLPARKLGRPARRVTS